MDFVNKPALALYYGIPQCGSLCHKMKKPKGRLQKKCETWTFGQSYGRRNLRGVQGFNLLLGIFFGFIIGFYIWFNIGLNIVFIISILHSIY